MLVPADEAEFVLSKKLATGASNVKTLKKVPTVVASRGSRARALPLPTGAEHARVEDDVQLIVAHTVLPTDALGVQSRLPPKLSPEIVTDVPPDVTLF